MHRSSTYYFHAWRMTEGTRNTEETMRRVRQRRRFDFMDLNEQEFINRYRLSKEAFLFLCRELKEKSPLRASNRISLEHKVICALSFYATGSYQRIDGMSKYVAQTTVSKIITEVTDALIAPSMLNSNIKFPTTVQQRNLIKNKFYTKFGIPGVIGAIDGSHFHIVTPPNDVEHLFFNRKHFYSLNVQMICDSDCRILNVNAKYGGATHDSFIWESSQANMYMQQLHQSNEQVWLLGDSGYPLRPWLMTPITNAPEGSPEAFYTMAHTRARVCIENTFGRLKNRWRCLCKHRSLHYSPDKSGKIILACCVLHNLALDYNVEQPDLEQMLEQAEQNPSNTIFVESGTDGTDLMRGRALRSALVSRLQRSN